MAGGVRQEARCFPRRGQAGSGGQGEAESVECRGTVQVCSRLWQGSVEACAILATRVGDPAEKRRAGGAGLGDV